MDKYDLLKSIGFSDEYISHLKNIEEGESSVFESVFDEYKPLSNDVSNVVVNEPINSFSTKLVIRPKPEKPKKK